MRLRTGGPGFAKLLLASAATLLGLIAGETLVRVSGAAPTFRSIDLEASDSVFRRSTNPLLGFELKANYRNPHADLQRTYPATNSHGQRDVERSLDRPEGTRRILVLGDSVVEGLGIRELADTIPGRLDRELGPQVEVLNFGVSGYCTLAEVELLRVKGLRFDPDVVLLVFDSNDFDNFNREAYRLAGGRSRPAGAEWLFRRSALFRMVALRFDLLSFGAEFDPVRWNGRAIGDDNVVRGLAMLRKLATEHGFGVRIAIWPEFRHDRIEDGEWLSPDSDELVVEALARNHDLPTLRLSRAFRDAMAGLPEAIDPVQAFTIGDGLHPSIDGAAVAARALAMAIGDELGDARDAVRRAARSDGGHALAVERSRELGSNLPTGSHVYNNLGVDSIAAGRIDEAISRFRLALVEDPGFVEARNNLANALRRTGRTEEALRQYRLALTDRPRSALMHFNLALVLAEQREDDEARDHFERAIEIDPAFGEARHGFGVFLRARGAYEAALERLREARDRLPESMPVAMDLADTLAVLGRFDEAAQAYRAATELAPGDARTWNGLGNARAIAGHALEATAAFRRALQLDPAWPPPAMSLARLLIASEDASARDVSEALRLVETALGTGPVHDLAGLETLVLVFEAAGRDEEATATALEGQALARERNLDRFERFFAGHLASAPSAPSGH